jgi:hypothetical protein
VSTVDETAYRTDPPQVGDERAMLAGWLAYQRGTLLWKCAGLTGAQLALATAEPSKMTLLSLLRHLSEEYARHNGHADLIRERLDGVTGE